MLSLPAVDNMRLVLRKNGSPKQYTLSPGPLMRPPPGSPSAVGGGPQDLQQSNPGHLRINTSASRFISLVRNY